MLTRLCLQVKPLHLAYLQIVSAARRNSCLNGVTAQPTIYTIFLDALLVELRHLAATSSSSPQPYDDLCSAVLACYGLTYCPLPGTRDFQVSP